MQNVNIQTKILVDEDGNKGELPCYSTQLAAGADVALPKDVHIPSNGRANWVDLLLSFDIPDGWCLMLQPRSSTSKKWLCLTDTGIIDADYKGSIHVALTNTADEDVVIPKGTRVAQLLVLPIYNVTTWMRKAAERDGGHGSTGD